MEDKQRAFVIGDVHGCLNTFTALLDQINYRGHEPLFLLGDYVNKGPSSVATLNFIIDLKNRYPKVFPLLGNHELYLLSYLTRTDEDWLETSEYLHMKRAGEFENLSSVIKQKFIDFISALPLYYETSTTYLVHAGFNFEGNSIMDDKNSMTTTRSFHYDAVKANHKRIIHGHLPVELAVIRKRVERKFPVIPIDNGCVYSGERMDMGSLCCIELEKMQLFTQSRID